MPKGICAVKNYKSCAISLWGGGLSARACLAGKLAGYIRGLNGVVAGSSQERLRMPGIWWTLKQLTQLVRMVL